MAHATPTAGKTPHLNTDAHRKVGWLELFYDLVYVATIVQLGNKLSEDISIEGFSTFALLFIPAWWIWMGTTFYNNRFIVDDLPHRALVFGQIFIVSALAIYVYDGLGETSVGFALAYAAARFLLVVMYYRAARFVPAARALASRYAVGFTIAAVLWFISAFVPPPFRFIIWIIGLAIDFGTPLSPQSVKLQRALPPSPHHLPERLGLFTIIVLGESFIKVIGAFAGKELEVARVTIGFLGLALVGGIWWIHSETIAERGVSWARRGVQTYIYAHLPLHLGLIALAVGIYKLATQHSEVLPDKYRLLITVAVAICLVSLGVIELWTDRGARLRDFGLRVVGAVIIIGIGLFGVGLNEFAVIGALLGIVFALAIVNLLRGDITAQSPEPAEIELG